MTADGTSAGAARPRVVVVLSGKLTCAGVEGRCRHALHDPLGAACTVVCDVSGITDIDAEAVDALARLQLEARRAGSRLHLRRPPRDLRALIELSGLEEALPLWRDQPAGR